MENFGKNAWLEKNGFNLKEKTYCIYGKNTYFIKDTLKLNGFCYSPQLGWHGPKNTFTLPQGYLYRCLNFSDLYVWNYSIDKPVLTDNGFHIMQSLKTQTNADSSSKYMSLMKGSRFQNLPVMYISTKSQYTNFGLTYIHTFITKNNEELIWITSTALQLHKNEEVILTATVKDFNEYCGKKQTRITRAIVRKVK